MKKNRIGEIHITNSGYKYTIIEDFGVYNLTIKFEDGNIQRNVRYGNVKSGEVKNLFAPIVCGVGYFGQGKYTKFKNSGRNTIYDKWSSMICRCYSKSRHEVQPTYKICTVDPSWHNFQNFAAWFEENFKPWMDSSWCLDKDISVKGNKVYSPETCLLVPQSINNIFKIKVRKIDLPHGVSKSGNKFKARININGEKIPLPTFLTISEAFNCYKSAKEAHIKSLADEWLLLIGEKAHKAMYNWIVEITD